MIESSQMSVEAFWGMICFLMLWNLILCLLVLPLLLSSTSPYYGQGCHCCFLRLFNRNRVVGVLGLSPRDTGKCVR